jgi:hypothetical protein
MRWKACETHEEKEGVAEEGLVDVRRKEDWERTCLSIQAVCRGFAADHA